MSSAPRLIYGYDPLCGWCYGAIPALRHVRAQLPNLKIEVLPGGLVTGDRIRPYSELIGYIRGASENLERVTGRKPSEAFFDMISVSDPPLASSLPPSDAVRQMNEIAPEWALEIAHAIQEAHFGAGMDVNDPALYAEITHRLGAPPIETSHWTDRAALEDLLAPSFAKSREFGIKSFPSFVLVTDQSQHLECSYDGVLLARYISDALPNV